MNETALESRIKQWVSFRYALADVVVTSLLVLGSTTRREGLDPWAASTYAELSPDLRADLQQVFVPLGGPLILSRLAAESPSLNSFAEFVGWLASLDPETVVAFVHDVLVWWGREIARKPDPAETLDFHDDAAVRERLLLINRTRSPEIELSDERLLQLLRLIRDPSELKSRLIYLVIQFWEGHFKSEYADCARRIEQNIEYHHGRVYEKDFAAFYYHVTSQRLMPGDVERYPFPERIFFIPSCYCGAAVILVPFDSKGRQFALLYNCRVPGQAGSARIAIRELYAPLRALADETRLEILTLLDGRERFGQEIVDSLDVGQSTVSRHLQLLVRSGVVLERKEGGMKFYRIDADALSQLSRLLSTYRAPEMGQA